MKYKITWTETVDMQDFVEAESEEEALTSFENRTFAEHMNAEPLTEMLVVEGSLKAEKVKDETV
tara:strand:- start:86 stop:277 length:192 start_codon:yes stop_codon:yes gene_type:complete